MLTLTWANLVQVALWTLAVAVLDFYGWIRQEKLLDGAKEMEWVLLLFTFFFVGLLLAGSTQIIK